MHDRYGPDVLKSDPYARSPIRPADVTIEIGMVVECVDTGFCGAVVGTEQRSVVLEDRNGRRRLFPLTDGGFLLEGKPVTLAIGTRQAGPKRSASGSLFVEGTRARVAAPSRIWVEGVHDAELVEQVWGHDLRVEGVVVEPLHGADGLLDALREFRPGPGRRVGVLLDHLVSGSKETRIAADARRLTPHVLVLGHPYVDVWQAVKPAALSIPAWPTVPKGQPWKAGVIDALGWPFDEGQAWRHILGRVRGYGDLEPALLGRVEELIDFVTAPEQ